MQIMSENTSVSTEKNNYSIYEYWTKSPTSVIGILTVILTVIMAILRWARFLYFTRLASYWHIPINLINMENISIWSDIVFSTILLFASYIHTAVINSSFSAFFSKTKTLREYKSRLKTVSKAIHNQQKIIKKASQSSASQNMDEEMDGLLKRIYSLKTDSQKIESDYVELRTDLKANMAPYIYKLILNIVASSVIYSFLNIVYLSKSSSIIISVLAAIFFSVIIILISWFLSRFSVNEGEDVKEYPITVISEHGIKPWTSNDSILRILAGALVYLFIICVISLSTASATARKQKEFQIFEYSKETYAIVYLDSSSIIAERIEIDNDTAIIHYDDQLYRENKEITFKNQKFENVTLSD